MRCARLYLAVFLLAAGIYANPQAPQGAGQLASHPLDWWSLKPLLKPAPPGDGHPVDAFVAQKLAEHGLAMAPEADARSLCRRIYFDLIGLPPAPEEIDAYAADRSPRKLEALVDRLLASPRYGERWARHWLDVVHYGDTHGYDKDQPRPHAWPYRDYVIRALNEDKPYARFVEEQIAGDALYPGTRDGIEALGFLAAGPWDLIGHVELPEEKIDGKIARHFDRDDMVGNALGTFTSTTVQCAQCHDHKFDPVTQRDYYALHAVFAAVDRADREYDVDPELAARRLALRAERDAAERAILAARETGVAVPPHAYGFHGALEKDALAEQWVQVDLGSRVALERVVLFPCWDDFNDIGAGFGFPARYRVLASDDPEFAAASTIATQDESDGAKRGIAPLELSAGGQSARYLRVVATKLASRQNDFAFALAELEAYDERGRNAARGASVASSSSIEAPPRWARSNLTDGITPLSGEGRALLERACESERALEALPSPQLVYAATVHRGTGNFRGTGAQGGIPREIRVLARGQVTQPGALAAPAAIAALDPRLPSRFSLADEHDERERRTALARWICDPRNPLTWRSIVNRLWQYHFGRGLAGTPNDFGRMGATPSHPELLDWLASTFRDDQKGSWKALHRLLLTSAAYRQASNVANARAAEIDRDNALLWRASARKLEAEALHDAMLAVSGSLDLAMGGPGWQDFVIERPEHSPHYRYDLADPEDPRTFRRAVYRFTVRSQTQPFLAALDCADPSMRVDKRNESLSPLQALALLHNGFVLVQSRRFAERVREEAGAEIAAQVARAFRLAFVRSPELEELTAMTAYVQRSGLPALCRALFNANEFAYVD